MVFEVHEDGGEGGRWAYCLVGAGWFLGASLGGDLVAIFFQIYEYSKDDVEGGVVAYLDLDNLKMNSRCKKKDVVQE